jgi:glyoxylase-like metal-dependent hydrolase (beta-lactamase superfamily II)
MKSPLLLKRRSFIAGSSALISATTAQAAAPFLGSSISKFRRFTLGDFEVTTILSGTRTINNNPQEIFGLNVSKENFSAVSLANNIPDDKFQMFYTPTVINTGNELILFDTGQNPGGTTLALNAAGYKTEQIDKVVLTHFHSDHIGGLYTSKGRTFKNASYYCGSLELEEWDFSGDENFEAKIRPLEDELNMINNGDDIVSGITAMAAHGHTPGHLAFMIESNGKQLMLGGDFANHYVWSLAYPDWELRFDRDREMAAKTRRKLLGMLAVERIPFVGYHMPWPGLGYVDTHKDGYHYVPASYQMML